MTMVTIIPGATMRKMATAISGIVAVKVGMARKTRKVAEDRISTFGFSIHNMVIDTDEFLGVYSPLQALLVAVYLSE